MRLIKEKLFSLLMSSIVVLFAHEAYIVMGGFTLTTNRIAILVLVACLAVRIGTRGNLLIPKTATLALWPILFCFFSALALLISKYEASFEVIVSWFLIGFTVFSLISIFHHRGEQFFFEVIFFSSLFGGLIGLWIFLLLISDVGLTNSFGFPVRRWFDETVQAGLSRFMNGWFVLTFPGLVLAISGGRVAERPISLIIKVILYGSFTLMMLVALAAGSRQTLLVVFVGISVVVLWRGDVSISKWLSKVVKVVVFLGVTVFSAYIYFSRQESLDWILYRLLERTDSELTEGSIRTDIYSTVIHELDTVLFFGYGPGVPTEILGMHPHNGYLGVMLEIGLMSGMIIIASLFGWIIVRSISPYRRRKFGLAFSLGVTFWIFAIISVNLNDLFRDYGFWILAAIYMTVISDERRVCSARIHEVRVSYAPT